VISAPSSADVLPPTSPSARTVAQWIVAHLARRVVLGFFMTIVMEMGLIHPPVGLNIFVI